MFNKLFYNNGAQLSLEDNDARRLLAPKRN